jgi:hypothetical protein
MPTSESPVLSSGTLTQIAHDWGGGEVLDSGRSDGVIVKYTGWLSAPTAQTYYVCANSDDGFRLYLDGVLVINDWYDRGGGCGQTADVDFSNGEPKQLEAYVYENGGGATSYLLYYTAPGWGFIPESWYTQTTPVTTTTTTTTTTTSTTTTTTTIVEETTTTTQPEETWPPTTESTPPTTMPTTTVPPVTAPVMIPPTPEPPAETQPPVEETVPVEETEPPSTEVSTPSSTPSTPEVETPEPSDAPTPSAPSAPEDSTESPSDTSANNGDTASTDAVTSEPVDAPTADSTAPTANDSTPPTLPEVPTASELVEYLTSVSPEDLQDLSEDEIASLIEDIASADLTDEEAEQLAVALSSAPPEVKKAFEEAVNIFGGQFDSYIPLDSKVPVKTRRVLIVVTAATFLLPSPSPRKVK